MDGSSWHCTGGSDEDPPQEKEMQKGKMVVWGGLTNSWEKRKAKGKGEKKRYTYLNAKFQRIVRRNTKAFPGDQCKGISQIESCYFHISIFKTQDYSDSK